MGNSGKWLKSLITHKNPPGDDPEKSKKKWKLWRSSSVEAKVSTKRATEVSVASFVADDTFAAAMATVIRAPPKDFMLIKQERAAIRVQAVFRGFLARRALRALKAVVRIQAIFRGRQVRKQAAVTLRCMQALVRVQARVRARCANSSPEGQAVEELLDKDRDQLDPIKQAERGWCDSPRTASEVREKLHMRQKGAIKRERAMAYSISQQRFRSSSSPYARTSKSGNSVKHEKQGKNSSEWSWLDRWMAAKPWDNRLLEEVPSLTPERTPFSRKSEDYSSSSSSGQDSVDVRRNNITTRISAKPLTENQLTRSSSSPSSEYPYEECSASTSSSSALSHTLVFSKSVNVDREEEIDTRKPSYMNLTQSTKAKQRAYNFSSPNIHKYLKDELQFQNKSMALSNGDTRSSAGSYPSMNLCKERIQI
ncbi:hypothetical protein UlMin_011892 [Ulmus minor]